MSTECSFFPGAHSGFFTSGTHDLVLNKSFKPTSSSSYQALYHHHLHIATELAIDCCVLPVTFSDLGISNPHMLHQLVKRPIVLNDGTRIHLEFFSTQNTPGRYSLVVWAGIVPAPTLLFITQGVDHNAVFVSRAAWKQWGKIILHQLTLMGVEK
jgi:hypothetical protein